MAGIWNMGLHTVNALWKMINKTEYKSGSELEMQSGSVLDIQSGTTVSNAGTGTHSGANTFTGAVTTTSTVTNDVLQAATHGAGVIGTGVAACKTSFETVLVVVT